MRSPAPWSLYCLCGTKRGGRQKLLTAVLLGLLACDEMLEGIW